LGVVIQASYKGGECKFYFSREKIVYFNIRGEESVFQASLKGEECNLLFLLNNLFLQKTKNLNYPRCIPTP